MASGFRPVGQSIGEQSPGTVALTITGSETITLGGAVKMVSGYASAATAGAKILGICVGLITNKGIDLDNATGLDGTYTPGAWGTASYAAASDNTTDQKVKAVVCIDKNAQYETEAAGNILLGHLFAFAGLASATQIAVPLVGDLANTFQIVKLHPNVIDGSATSTTCTVKIAESQLDAYSLS